MGRILHDLRIAAKLGQLPAALRIDVSPQTIGRLEDGVSVRISTVQLEALLDLYGADSSSRADVMQLWKEVKEAKSQRDTTGWWKPYADVTYGQTFDHYLSLESAANRLRTFQLTLLPGLVQTAAYRRSITLAANPELSQAEIDRRIELMVLRQTKRLSGSGDFAMDVLLSEMALRLPVGDPDVMSEQLIKLIHVGQLPNVSIRVVPQGVIGHPGLVIGSFTLCEFPMLPSTRLTEPPVVYVEGYEGALFLEDNREVTRYRNTLTRIRHVALTEEESRTLILEVVESLR
ncbi:XRE family transcriptional regulator [Nocardia terpenica]|uniref:XRE family transcriptional regulator n=2 Tax=Nocardia terpenica TaxID=455432 RepID=A0A291RXR9_9NOCA|nr:XRE family transcriptional regulator [Nocardia terpenica]